MQNLSIIFEDGNFLVINKPSGLVVDKSETQQDNTLEDWLGRYQLSSPSGAHSRQLERQGIVHRLDKETSGLLLVAKTQSALENLQAQFKERKVKKQYLALVHGTIDKGVRVEASIGRNPGNREKFTVLEKEGKEAVTEYEPLEKCQMSNVKCQMLFSDFNKIQMRKLERMNYNQFTLLSCRPLTGRTHQIRVHLKYINFPIVSDEKYVGRKIYRLDKRWCPRLFLHAAKIGFYHPKTNEWVEFESELPEDLKEALGKLEIHHE